MNTYRAMYWVLTVADSGDDTDMSPKGEYGERIPSVDDLNGASRAMVRPEAVSLGRGKEGAGLLQQESF